MLTPFTDDRTAAKQFVKVATIGFHGRHIRPIITPVVNLAKTYPLDGENAAPTRFHLALLLCGWFLILI